MLSCRLVVEFQQEKKLRKLAELLESAKAKENAEKID